MTYRLENRVVWKIAAGAFMESARILFDVIASPRRARRDRIALDTIEDLGQRDDFKRLDPMGHRRPGLA